MTEPRDKMLSEFHQGLAGIDPVLDRAADYGRGIRAVQSVVRSQGQVMSQTLSNNQMLWDQNKQLKAENGSLKYENAELKRANQILGSRVDELEKTLEESGGDRYRALYQQAMRTLESNLHDLLEPDQLAAKLDEMKRQQAELIASGATLPALPDGEAIQEHATAAGLGEL